MPVRVLAGFWEKAGAWAVPVDSRGEGYWTVARQNTPQVGFCLLFVFASSWGQTFLLSVFQPSWMQALAIGPGTMGAIYGGATLASGLLLSATAPVVFGFALERGVSVEAILFACAVLLLGLAWPLSLAVR